MDLNNRKMTNHPPLHAKDVRAPFLFVGDLNGRYQKWLGSTFYVMVLQPLTSQLCLVAISCLSARPMHVVKDLTA